MKPFNKAEALKGAPVVLRNGAKAFVKFEIPADQLINSDIKEALYGYIVGPLNIAETTFSWKENGRAWLSTENELDIVGMWEEPRKQATITFPAPLNKPIKIGSEYFSITPEFEVIKFEFNGNRFDMIALECGFMFATRRDAQAFLDAMKAARA